MKKSEKIKQKELNKSGYKIKLASELKTGPKVRTGIYALDYVLDRGLYQGEGGHRIEFFGRENSCKTTFAICIIAKFQELGKKCVYINAEQSYDKIWGEILGVDNSKLYIADPDTLEQAGDMLIEFVYDYDLIIIDSIPALATQEELNATLEDKKQMASQSKVFAPLLRKMYNAIKESSLTPVIIFINQMREKVGIMFGNPETTPGGRALRHFYNTRIEFKLGKPIKEGVNETVETIGYELFLKNKKNKRGKAYREAAIDFYLNGHLDNQKSLFYNGIKFGIIERIGNTYKFNDIKIVGEKKFKETMQNKDWKKVENEIWSVLK